MPLERNRILFILDDFYPTTSAGSVRIHSFIEELRDQDVEVVGGATNEPLGDSFLFKTHLVRRPPETRPLLFALFLMRFILKTFGVLLKNHYDRIILSVPKYELLILAPFLKHRTSFFLLDLRDSHSFLNYRSYAAHFLSERMADAFGKMMTSITRWMLKRALHAATLISVANSRILDSIVGEHPNATVIANGVDTDLFRPSPRRFEGMLNLIYLGNFAEKDRFDDLIEVLPAWRQQVIVHLVGDGRNKSRIVRELQEANISFRDHGILNHSNLPSVLQQMHVGVIFRDESAVESIPVAIFEFCAMNIPTLTNDVGLMAEVVRKYGLGKIISSSEQLKEFLQQAISDSTMLDEFADLHDVAMENFSRKAEARKFREYLLG